MKPLIVFSDVTVDGFMAGPDNDLDFMVDDPQLEDELTGMLMSVADTIVVGRKAFPDIAPFPRDGAVLRSHPYGSAGAIYAVSCIRTPANLPFPEGG